MRAQPRPPNGRRQGDAEGLSGRPYGLAQTYQDKLNADLLAFIKG